MKKFINILLALAVFCCMIPVKPVKAEYASNEYVKDTNNISIEKQKEDLLSNFIDDLILVSFVPEDEEEFKNLSDDTIIFQLDGINIYKKNLNTNYNINTDSLNLTNVDDAYINNMSRAGASYYIIRPNGKTSATVEVSIVAPSYSQNTLDMYFGPQTAYRVVASIENQPDTTALINTITSIILGYVATPTLGAVFTAASYGLSYITNSYLREMTNLAIAGKKVRFNTGRSTYGAINAVFEWDGLQVEMFRSTGSGTTIECNVEWGNDN